MNNTNTHPIALFPRYRVGLVKFFSFSWRYLCLTHSFSITFENITINHVLLKTRFFGVHLSLTSWV